VGVIAKLRRTMDGFRAIWTFDNRYELIARRVFFRRTGILTYRKGDMEIVVDHHGGDETGTRECLTSPMYPALLKDLTLRGPLTVFDIGANGGGFPLMLLDAGLRVERVAAVEMNPRTFGRMQLNLLQNLDGETCLINAAICGAPTTLKAHFGRGSTGESITDATGGDSAGRLTLIEGLTFDQAFDRAFGPRATVDLCKMDIEGAEYDVFANPGHERLRGCRNLIIEIHQVAGKDPQDVIDALGALGFQETAGSRGTHSDVYCFANAGAIVSSARTVQVH
jgi:FkbM family methyltransferase